MMLQNETETEKKWLKKQEVSVRLTGVGGWGVGARERKTTYKSPRYSQTFITSVNVLKFIIHFTQMVACFSPKTWSASKSVFRLQTMQFLFHL